MEKLTTLEEQGFLKRYDQEGASDDDFSPASRFLDLGTGNGHMLFTLREGIAGEEFWGGEMVGVDYSVTSIDLARRLGVRRNSEDIRFEEWDLLTAPPGNWLQGGFDVVLDKGTFDAISLMTRIEGTRNSCHLYRDNVIPLIRSGGFLLITSCNWTRDELQEWLVTPNSGLEYYDEIKYPTFMFGGKTGSSIVTLVLKRL